MNVYVKLTKRVYVSSCGGGGEYKIINPALNEYGPTSRLNQYGKIERDRK